jgi:hypothetical protein
MKTVFYTQPRALWILVNRQNTKPEWQDTSLAILLALHSILRVAQGYGFLIKVISRTTAFNLLREKFPACRFRYRRAAFEGWHRSTGSLCGFAV